MEVLNGYKDLLVWKKGMLLAKEIYRLSCLLPKQETFGLVSQLRRAAVSVPSNIAEGYGRETTQEYLRFLRIARGSDYEVDTQLWLCVSLGYFTKADAEQAFSLCDEIARMLYSMIKKISPA